jgi:hypothetical protein
LTGSAQGVRQLAPLEILASAPGGVDLSERRLTESVGLPGPGITEHAEKAIQHNTNPTLRIEIPPVR